MKVVALFEVLLFEVMDKEPSLGLVWLTCLFLGIGGFVVSRYKVWLVVVVIGIAVMFSLMQIGELRNPLVGPEIVREAGYSYVVQSYVAAGISILLPCLGLLMKLRSQARNSHRRLEAENGRSKSLQRAR